MVREGLTVGGDSQSADPGRTAALSIGGLPLAGHLGPEAALEGRRLAAWSGGPLLFEVLRRNPPTRPSPTRAAIFWGWFI